MYAKKTDPVCIPQSEWLTTGLTVIVHIYCGVWGTLSLRDALVREIWRVREARPHMPL